MLGQLGMNILPSIIGQQQLGGVAPAFGGSGGLLSMEAIKRLTPDMSDTMKLPTALMQGADPVGEVVDSSPVPEGSSLVEGDKGFFKQFGGMLGEFDKGLEKGLSSPSQLDSVVSYPSIPW